MAASIALAASLPTPMATLPPPTTATKLALHTEQAFHQSRLADTVLAHQRMDCAGAHIEIYPFERLHTGKCFGNAAPFRQ